ncbi:MAG: DUF6125 family protein [Desulfarculaceae bacterium]|nr:DUF6125 family protein [Desulfarculaceae bacterium]MCF8070928.1 DUF6125 family protein [Desulfarculaceae bacterium]MCF8100516.1 DUF6125 family protein [Desulfarculaceae bacterium]MCF8116542.1 DUF6125 family protein [Desulfarculaceae bacterium]
MPSLSNRQAYAALSRAQLEDLLEFYGRQALVLDGLWFLGAETRWGHGAALELDEEVWARYGANEAKRLLKVLGQERVENLEQVCRLFLLSPLWGILGARAEVTHGKARLWVTQCRPQMARVRKGLGEFDCKQVGINYFQAWLPVLHPGLDFACAFCPPDAHPDQEWCRWEVWFAE